MRPFTREDLSRLPSHVLSTGRNRTKADVLLVEWNGEPVVAKDFRARGFLVRNSIGRFSVARECRAYERLGGVAGLPRLLGRIDRHAFAYHFVPGTPLPRLARHSLPSSFFAALEAMLAAVHARGVAIADLHHRNVIVAEPAGSPAMIDLSLSLTRPSRWNMPARWLFSRAQELDRIALERIRARYEAPTRASFVGRSTNDFRASGTRLHFLGRSLKRIVRRVRGKT